MVRTYFGMKVLSYLTMVNSEYVCTCTPEYQISRGFEVYMKLILECVCVCVC